MSGDGKSDALAWILTTVSGDDAAVTEDDLVSAIAAAASGLGDKNAAASCGLQEVDVLAASAPQGARAKLVAASSLPPALKSAVSAHVEKNALHAPPSAPGFRSTLRRPHRR